MTLQLLPQQARERSDRRSGLLSQKIQDVEAVSSLQLPDMF
uniref:Uncharacterized protein n=1 Tax=Faecalibaculum rodentium TaxID=1702221 RepID=A0A140DUD6_9FIRM|nr:hypothetical protein AALO17_11290 [Faecalibaculum rodentium]